jgi:hypothetical protein
MTAADVKRSLHRGVQHYAASQSTELWRGAEVEADWSQRNLSAVERLAQHVLELADDDPRFVAVADAYEGQEWRLREPLPWEPVSVAGSVSSVRAPAACPRTRTNS